MTRFEVVSLASGKNYVALQFRHLPRGDNYYLTVHEHAYGQTLAWHYKSWSGLPSLPTTEEGIPLGGVEFALAQLTAYRLAGNVSPS